MGVARGFDDAAGDDIEEDCGAAGAERTVYSGYEGTYAGGTRRALKTWSISFLITVCRGRHLVRTLRHLCFPVLKGTHLSLLYILFTANCNLPGAAPKYPQAPLRCQDAVFYSQYQYSTLLPTTVLLPTLATVILGNIHCNLERSKETSGD
jgi:hypothetical protein